jgi:hypothetical protein
MSQGGQVIVTCVLCDDRDSRFRIYIDFISWSSTIVSYFPLGMQPIVYNAAEHHTRDVLYVKYLMSVRFQPRYERARTMLWTHRHIPLPTMGHPLLSVTADEMINSVLLEMMPTVFLQSH